MFAVETEEQDNSLFCQTMWGDKHLTQVFTQRALTGFPTLLISNCRGTPFGIFFSAASTTTGAEVAAGGCRVQAVGGLQHSHTVISHMYIFKYVRNVSSYQWAHFYTTVCLSVCPGTDMNKDNIICLHVLLLYKDNGQISQVKALPSSAGDIIRSQSLHRSD